MRLFRKDAAEPVVLDTTGRRPPSPWAYDGPKCGALHQLGPTVIGPNTEVRCQWPAGHVGPHGIDYVGCATWSDE